MTHGLVLQFAKGTARHLATCYQTSFVTDCFSRVLQHAESAKSSISMAARLEVPVSEGET